jgi:hypothetical protein
LPGLVLELHVAGLERVDLVAVREQQELRHVGVGDERARGVPHRDDRAAGGDALEPRPEPLRRTELDEQRRRHRGRRGERLGQRGAAGLFEHQHRVDLVAAEPAVRLGHQQAQHAELGQLAPQLRRVRAAGVPLLAHVGGRALGLEEIPGRLLEQELLLAEGEVHGYLGSPSRRSAITLRWISLVPA